MWAIGAAAAGTSRLGACASAGCWGAGAGTFYAFEMQNPTFTNGVCAATYAVLKRTAGSVYSLGSFTASCATNSLVRVIRPGDVEEGRDAADHHEEQQHEDASSGMIEGMEQGPSGSA